MDSFPDANDPISEIVKENLELKKRLDDLSWDLQAIKASSTYALALRMQKLGTRFASPRGALGGLFRKLSGAAGAREPVAERQLRLNGPSASLPNVPASAANREPAAPLINPIRVPVPILAAGAPVHCFTTLTTNQLPKARVLAKTLKASNPGWQLHVVMPEPLAASINPKEEPFDSFLTIHDLGIDNLQSWLFKHSVVEAANAVKGAGALALFKRHGMDRLIYLDSDIGVFGDMTPIVRLLDEHPLILTPHATEPESDPWQVRDKELSFTRCGTFNLGFFALRADCQGCQFLQWWWDRLRDWCYIDMQDGLFVDQGWCDLAPAYFDRLHVLRDSRYNVASWNLTHRKMTIAEDGTLLVDGEPLAFFHFSSYDAGITRVAIKNSVQDENDAALRLFDWYAREVTDAGQETLNKFEWAYSRFTNGRPIEQIMRRLYRSRPDLQSRFPDPFDTSTRDSFAAWWDTQKV